MRLFDLVEQHDAEGPLADRIGQFAANIIADIAGRRADQALVSMLRAKLGHVEPDIRSEEHTSELQSLMRISYAVFCLKKKTAFNHHTIAVSMLTRFVLTSFVQARCRQKRTEDDQYAMYSLIHIPSSVS